MKWTPFKQGKKDGQNLLNLTEYTGRKRHDYISGYTIGARQYIIKLINAEVDPCNTITNPINQAGNHVIL